MTHRPTNQVANQGQFFFGGGGHNCRLIAQETGRSSFGDAPRSEQQQHGRDGTDFPFKISSRDLTGCHYCAALSDGSADERAIAVGNRHEKVDQMEARDTQALEGRRQRDEPLSHSPRNYSNLFSCTFIWPAAIKKKNVMIICHFYSSLFKEKIMKTVIFIYFRENYPNWEPAEPKWLTLKVSSTCRGKITNVDWLKKAGKSMKITQIDMIISDMINW